MAFLEPCQWIPTLRESVKWEFYKWEYNWMTSAGWKTGRMIGQWTPGRFGFVIGNWIKFGFGEEKIVDCSRIRMSRESGRAKGQRVNIFSPSSGKLILEFRVEFLKLWNLFAIFPKIVMNIFLEFSSQYSKKLQNFENPGFWEIISQIDFRISFQCLKL